MSLFRRPRSSGPEAARAYKELQDRVHASGLDSVEKEAWELQKNCFLQLKAGDESVAGPLCSAARLSFIIEASHSQWITATAAALNFSVAIQSIGAQCEKRGVPFPEALRPEIQQMADWVVYVAHRSGVPLAGCMLAEKLTSQMFGDRTYKRELSEVLHRHDPIKELRSIQRTLARMSAASTAALAVEPNEVPSGQLQQMFEAMLLDDLRAGTQMSAASYVLTASSPVHALHGASSTGRSVIYLAAGAGAGTAIRLEAPRTGLPLCESIELPDFSLETVRAQIKALRDDLKDPRVRVRDEAVNRALDKVSESVWDPVIAAWPDLSETRVALVPIGESALLPLYTAPIDGVPACATTDLTIAPSGNALMLASLWPLPTEHHTFVAADPWSGPHAIRFAEQEAEKVAAIHGVQPHIMRSPGPPEPDGVPDGTEHVRGLDDLRQSTIADAVPDDALIPDLAQSNLIHIACHGEPDPHRPLQTALLLGRRLSLSTLLENDLKAGATVILSACDLASIGTEFAAEQLGFPAGLLAIGARSVIGPLWAVPDTAATVDLMIELHRDLRDVAPSVALGQAIGRAAAAGVRPSVWAPFAHFGG